jgi:hypothetical protein
MECNIRRTDGTVAQPRIVGFFDRPLQVAFLDPVLLWTTLWK